MLRTVCLCLLGCLLSLTVWAGGDSTEVVNTTVYAIELPKDSSLVNVRQFSQEQIEQLRSNDDYRYNTPPPPTDPSLWARFVAWISKMLALVLLEEESNSWLRGIIYVLAGGLILYAILKLLGVDIRGVFYKKSDSHVLRSELMEEDLHLRNFDQEISLAVTEQRYREAIRLHYLQSLQKLSDAQLIHWKIDKTNQEYGFELRSNTLRAPFAKITNIFENVYYGNFPVTQPVFEKASTDFQNFKSLVPTHATA